MKYTLLMLFVTIVGTAKAYDFAVVCTGGCAIHCNILEGDAAEIVSTDCKENAYAGTLEVPQTVEYDGKRYTMTRVGRRAFADCAGLQSVVLPPTVTEIGDFAFAGCRGLERFTIPKSLAILGVNVFDGCFALTDINVASGNSHFTAILNVLYDRNGTMCCMYPQGIDGGCTLSPGTRVIGDNAFWGCSYLPGIELGASVEEIGRNAFYYCGSLTEVRIPREVMHIGRCAFGDCLSLERIDVAEGNLNYASVDGVLYDRGMETLIQLPCAREDAAFSVDEAVRVVGEYSCMRNYNLTDVALREGVNHVAEGAFIDCANMRTLTLPSTLRRIDAMAFGMCHRLESVYVPWTDPAAVDISVDAFVTTQAANRILYVPTGASDAYRNAAAWQDFDLVLEYDNIETQRIMWEIDADLFAADSLTVTMSAMSTSGLPVQYVLAPGSQGLAEIHGNTLRILRGGEITVVAMQPGNQQYLPASPVSRVINTPVVGVLSPEMSRPVVLGMRGRIEVEGAADDDVVDVYDLQGVRVYSGTDRDIPVQSHRIYVVRVGEAVYKILVK